MITLLEFIGRIAPIIYGLSVIGILFGLRGMTRARRALRVAVFGLEREASQERLRRSISSVITLLLLCGTVYIIRNILLPNFTGQIEEPTPTPIVFVTQQATPTEVRLLYPTITATAPIPPVNELGTPLPTSDPTINGCEIFGATITSPIAGQTVSGQVNVEGQANILNFALYKFEINGPSTAGSWVVVGTFLTAVPEGYLGTWDSTSLLPGNYVLRLVVMTINNTYPTPCQVSIVIAGTGGVTSP